MTTGGVSLETLFREKQALYHRLAETVRGEREQIAGADVDTLWRISEKKQRLVSEILALRGRILDEADRLSIDHGMIPRTFRASRLVALLPVDLKRRIDPVELSVTGLKKEIRSLCIDNKQYIETKLGMIDELIAIMTGRERRPRYGCETAVERSGSPMLMRQRV